MLHFYTILELSFLPSFLSINPSSLSLSTVPPWPTAKEAFPANSSSPSVCIPWFDIRWVFSLHYCHTFLRFWPRMRGNLIGFGYFGKGCEYSIELVSFVWGKSNFSVWLLFCLAKSTMKHIYNCFCMWTFIGYLIFFWRTKWNTLFWYGLMRREEWN